MTVFLGEKKYSSLKCIKAKLLLMCKLQEDLASSEIMILSKLIALELKGKLKVYFHIALKWPYFWNIWVWSNIFYPLLFFKQNCLYKYVSVIDWQGILALVKEHWSSNSGIWLQSLKQNCFLSHFSRALINIVVSFWKWTFYFSSLNSISINQGIRCSNHVHLQSTIKLTFSSLAVFLFSAYFSNAFYVLWILTLKQQFSLFCWYKICLTSICAQYFPYNLYQSQKWSYTSLL